MLVLICIHAPCACLTPSTHRCYDSGETQLRTVAQCTLEDPTSDALTHPTVFEQLSADELVAVREWMRTNLPTITGHSLSGLGPDGELPPIWENYINTIELWHNPKSEVLNYLDNSGSRPGRYARVSPAATCVPLLSRGID